MFSRAIHRVTAWLCLLAALWIGVLPARALVVCVEPDGCVNLEPAVAGRCADVCGSHEPDQGVEHQDATDVAAPGSDDDCACSDLLLRGSDHERVRTRSVPPPIAPQLAIAPVPVPPALRPVPVHGRTPTRDAWWARPPSELRLARSVVLLV